MYLRWDYLFWAIFFFTIALFNPLLAAVGPMQTTIIICTGLVVIGVVKTVEYITYAKRGYDEDDDDS